jgi:hypothetical protein
MCIGSMMYSMHGSAKLSISCGAGDDHDDNDHDDAVLTGTVCCCAGG